jgi:hypothetical protein
MKKLLSIVVLALGVISASTGWAECSIGHDRGCPKAAGSGCPIMNKLMKKAHFLLSNQAEIGLSEAQVAEIKNIKLWAKKSMINKEAQMQVFMIDMETKLSEETLDMEGINAMIDKGTADMAQGAKETVDAYAKLKAVLTPEQMAKAKAIWKKK